MKKYFLLIVFFVAINFLAFSIPKIKIEINIINQSSSIVKAQESPFSSPETFNFSIFEEEKSKVNPHCISLEGTGKFASSIIYSINSKYNSGYRLKGFGISSRNPNTNVVENSFETVDEYIAILCIDN